MDYINAKFVSQKISKTRWRPVSSSSLQQPDIFATGSWDNEENKLSLWSVGELGLSSMEEDMEGDPQLLCDIRHKGDVLDLSTLSVSQLWDRAHHYPCDSAPCTGVVCNSPEIVTVGEDGRIILFRVDHKSILRTIENADSSTIHAVTFLRTTEVLTVNSIGQLKLWDFRQQGNDPVQILYLTGDRVPLHSVDRHPNQQHIVATGGQDGMLCIWDVRHGSIPFSLMEAHSAESGRNASVISRGGVPQAIGNQSLTSSWLSGDSSKGHLETTHMLPSQTLSVNSLDVLGQCLVCGTDGEAIYVNRHVPV
ncbi:nucleoporin Nup43-like [Scleropages formosus]|uniref:Nucleoporin Nup43-like n=1 Tax=Scleropages formosus TaxID=113540 RepID=A0A0N8K379_SCLFO|nr:nucleoporin Nup43-like [Scleropages formosus]